MSYIYTTYITYIRHNHRCRKIFVLTLSFFNALGQTCLTVSRPLENNEGRYFSYDWKYAKLSHFNSVNHTHMFYDAHLSHSNSAKINCQENVNHRN